MNALVTGATGFVGRRLVERLTDPTVLTRNREKASRLKGAGSAFRWEPTEGPPPREAFEGIDAIFHLAGEPVAGGRWTESRKQRIRESRVIGTRNLVEALRNFPQKPKALISASAIGFYGSRGDEVLDESSEPGTGFLGDVCREWESEAQEAERLGVRVVCVRIGIVLGAGGGALAAMLTPFRLGVGGRLGSGKQWMSWIHRDDLVEMMLFAAGNESASGAWNGVSPKPCTNREFTKTLAGRLRRPALFPAPAPALRLAVGEFASVLLASQRVEPRAPLRAGFEFQFTSLDEALAEALSPYASEKASTS